MAAAPGAGLAGSKVPGPADNGRVRINIDDTTTLGTTALGTAAYNMAAYNTTGYNTTGYNNAPYPSAVYSSTAALVTAAELRAAHSLDRLDALGGGDPGDPGAYDLYRCPSFPRLSPRRPRWHLSARTLSTTHLETNSLSPRVSTDNLTLVTRDSRRLDLLSLGAHGLMRSLSSELPPTGPEDPTAPGLLPLPTSDAPDRTLVSRSTSCPSMAYSRRSPSLSPRSPESPRLARRLAGSGHISPRQGAPHEVIDERGVLHSAPYHDGDVNLDGEVISDLPIEPGQHFPDFPVPEVAGGPKAAAEPPPDDPPMHTRRVRLTKPQDKALSGRLIGPAHPTSPAHPASPANPERRRADFVNIGDIPATVAEKVMTQNSVYRPETDVSVRRKCLQWLDSLDNDS